MTKNSLVDELFEDEKEDKKIIKSFYSKSTLCPVIFHKNDEKYTLIDTVRKKLLSISNQFIDFLGVDFFIYDIVITGSLANYNWSEYSDIDLHIIIDYEASDYQINLLKEFFNSKKNEWNRQYKIKIKDFDVELYVQDINEPHISSGVYSVLNDKWVVEPQKEKNKIDENLILEKGEEYGQLIDDLITKYKNNKDIKSDIDLLMKKIKKFRQSGLEKGGEYSYENLTFKLLRRNGYIGKLIQLKKDTQIKKLSLKETKNNL